ncbi:hypothetical protein [Sphingobacterium chungjuense]|uniref:hypothetical protein n=1 Tax=Sphingobacterium chungjuense TaxID=2675553 RepID=UPI0019CFFEFB|nr:hypothetical protein [Sphingobacterium chungjuense]
MKRIDKKRKAKKIISDFYRSGSHVLMIHYSCESFYNIVDGRTPRVTSIAVRYLSSAQTKSFSIHKIAEVRGFSLEEIDLNYDSLEKEMLDEFFSFMEAHRTFSWIHWNMRDISYGFEALKHRAIVLGIRRPFELPDNVKFDLARILIDLYGKNYADHPRLPSLLKQNDILPKNWLDGEDEARAFEEKEFVKLHQSTLSKVSVFENILVLIAENRLKNKSSFADRNGIGPQAVYESIKDHWLFVLVSLIVGAILSSFIGYII